MSDQLHKEPGAPQPGDVVTVVWDGAPDDTSDGGANDQALKGFTTRLLNVHTEPHKDQYPWLVEKSYANKWVHQVRRPTEAELAAWAIVGGHE